MRFHPPSKWYAPCLLLFLALAVSLASPPAVHSQAKVAVTNAPISQDLDAARTALAKYRDPFAAIKDGYFSTLACIDFPSGVTDGNVVYPPGAMGVHFLNPANIGPKLDPAKPQVLIYEPVGDKLVLAAAEWFVPVAIAGDAAPSIFGQTLAGPMDGHEPIMPGTLRHYDLHVWLWKDNPKGIFTSTNAAIKCSPGSPYTIAMSEMHHH